jgi:Ferritin-like
MPISSREELIDHLNIASELEHGVMVQYLFAAFSMKKSTTETLKPYQEWLVKSWERKILQVAREEMGHLGTVCNLLSAIGAAPHFGRPNFPQPAKTYYPFEIKLTRFCDEAIYRFIRHELPKDVEVPDPPASLSSARALLLRTPIEYQFVGELYGKLRDAFNRLDRLFIGPRFAQDTDTWSGRMNLCLVKDKKTASQAIDFIVTEGEGSPGHRQDSHYGAFLEIRKQLAEQRDLDPGFEPARNVIDNPRAMEKHADAPTSGNYITNEQTRKIAELFNDVYEISVAMLMQFYSFGGETPSQRVVLQNAAREIMSVAVRPLGEILTELPACEPDDGRVAGAPFEFFSTLRLPPQTKPRWLILLERLQNAARGIAVEAKHQSQKTVRRRLASIAQKLDWIRRNIEKVLVQEFVLTPKR